VEFLAIDHVNGRTWERGQRPKHEGGDHLVRRLIRLSFPDGYRILCHNCNAARSYDRRCPHENARAADSVIAEVTGVDKDRELLSAFDRALRRA